jgi:hypothetical protein
VPNSTSTPTLTPAIAQAHERLYPRVTALLAQVEKLAGRHSQQPVPGAMRDVAKALFAEARKVLGREALRNLGGATADLGALSIGLGQLVAGLEAFEAAHSGWSGRAKCTVWTVEGPVMPVKRLKPAGVEAGQAATSDREANKARKDLTRLIMGRFVAGYDEGYRDASEGRPPSSRYAEQIWDGQVKKAGGNDEAARLRLLQERYGTITPPPHLMPVGAKLGEWKRIEAERTAAEKAERLARSSAARTTD